MQMVTEAEAKASSSFGPSLKMRLTLQFRHIRKTMAGTMLFTRAVFVAFTLSVIVHAPQVKKIMVTR